MYASSPLGRPGNVGFSPSNPIQLAPIYATPNGMRAGPGGYGAGMPSSPGVGARPGSSPSGMPPPQSPMMSSPPHSGGGAQMMGMSGGAGGQPAAGGASGGGGGGMSGLPAAMMQKIANQFGVVPRYENGKFVMKHTPGSENRAKFTPHQKQEKEDKKRARAAYSTPRSTSQVQGPYAHILSSGDFEVVLRYDFSYSTRTWTQTCMVVNIQKRPFAEGSLRGAYRAIDLNKPAGTGEFVAKQYKSREDQASYFADVEMQGICEFYAEKYNAKGAPKPVTFLHAFLIERVQKQGRPLFACEDFLKGKFDKFNNNYGFKSQGDEATPQTFSHFTFEYSDRTLMVVDIQGIAEGDSYTYTDPQIHTSDGKGYGKGNLGRDGMMKFFGTHLCNNICVGIGLSRTQKGGFQSTAMNPQKIEEARKRRQALLEDKEKENAPREPPLPAQQGQYVASQGSPGLAPQPAPVQQHQEKYLQPPQPQEKYHTPVQQQEKYHQPAQQQEKVPTPKAEH